MINLGVIGLGPLWESYRAVLPSLRQPPQISAVYDPITSRAEEVARPLNAKVATGIQALVRRNDVDAVLLADVSWLGASPLTLLSQCHKPIFVAMWLPADLETYARWSDATSERGVTLMPAMWRRFMPVTVRLKELIATEVGQPQHVTLRLNLARDLSLARVSEAILGWLDFICYLIPREPTLISQPLPGSEQDKTTLELEFPATKPHPIEGSSSQAAGKCVVQIHVDWSAPRPTGNAEPLREVMLRSMLSGPEIDDWMQPSCLTVPDVELLCGRGTVTVRGRTNLSWSTKSGATRTESLEQDRSERVVMLDHFCRRAVGGLIPVADYHDLYKTLRIALGIQ